MERARSQRVDFALTDANREAVFELCRRLEGIPLAIELAAARVHLLTPQAMLERLDDRLELLVAKTADLPPRQRTLTATIEWSHELLTPDERRLFARLAVFAGGFTLNAVEGVCGDDLDVLDTLSGSGGALARDADGRARCRAPVPDVRDDSGLRARPPGGKR